MNKKWTNLTVWGVGVALFLTPLTARAEFLIEFLDGRTVTVGQYFEEKSEIKVYTPQGSIGFPKSEVKRVISVDEYRAGVPLETVSVKHADVSSSSLPESQNNEELGRKTDAEKQQAGKEGKEGEDGKAKKMTDEEAAEKYQDINHQHSNLWAKHMQDVNNDAPEEVLEENRRQLHALDDKRSELLKDVRSSDGQMPEWAQ